MAMFTGRGIRGHARVESRDSDTLTPLTDFSPRYEHYRSDSNPYFNTYDGLRTPDFDRSRTPEPFVQSPPFAEAIPDSEDAPLRRATPQPYRRGVSADDYTSPKLPPIRPRPRERKRFAWKWPSRTGLILKLLFCFSAFVAYAYFTVRFLIAELNPQPWAQPSSFWRIPMIITALVCGTGIVILFLFPIVNNRVRGPKSLRTINRDGLPQYRSNKQLLYTGLLLIPCFLILPVNFAVTPIIVADIISNANFNKVCNGFATSYLLDQIPSSQDGIAVTGNIYSAGNNVGSLVYQGGQGGWRITYTRSPYAPHSFNDSGLTQVAFQQADLGTTFTVLCTPTSSNVSANVDSCVVGSSISAQYTNTSLGTSIFTSNAVPVVSMFFAGPEIVSYSANYSMWSDQPPLGGLWDQNGFEQIKVAQKGSGDGCSSSMMVCGDSFLESFVSMGYIWRRWGVWGISQGHCGN